MNIIGLFNELYTKYQKRIFDYFKICFDSDIADDLTQLVFLKLWKQLSKHQNEPENWNAWLFRVAINVKNDFLRTKYAAPQHHSLTDWDETSYSAEEDMVDTLCINNALNSISTEQKELLLLKANGLTSTEIGNLLNISASTVRSRINAAKQVFKKQLVHHDIDLKT